MKPLDRSKDRKARGEHHAHADCDAERLVLDLPAQAVDCCIKVVPGYEFGHDELPSGFGVGFRMILRDAVIAKVLRISRGCRTRTPCALPI